MLFFTDDYPQEETPGEVICSFLVQRARLCRFLHETCRSLIFEWGYAVFRVKIVTVVLKIRGNSHFRVPQ